MPVLACANVRDFCCQVLEERKVTNLFLLEVLNAQVMQFLEVVSAIVIEGVGGTVLKENFHFASRMGLTWSV